MSQAIFDHKKYTQFPPIHLKQRQWPDKIINKAPKWCSVDLRDGNQALVNPLSVQQKLQFFKLLVAIGFKEIEVGFPSASENEFTFIQELIAGKHIPDDVTIAILTPAREAFIKRSFEALIGVKKAIIHFYNPTSTIQRKKVFNKNKSDITKIVVEAAQTIQHCASTQKETQWKFQYSPESFTGTELDYAVDICNAVIDAWQPDTQNPVIINLPSTVELAMPNIYADQIEWFCQHINRRENVIISIHTHNDRGCAVAAAEMAILAGAQRVEGTLLGNGERTGNMDIITMAMNYYSQGIDPELDLSNIQSLSKKVSQLINIQIHPRHPYIGELVYTAFSGSHQDAISKCLKAYNKDNSKDKKWDIAYLPIDPEDLGRSYQEVIRINSQSGKGGMSYIIEQAISTELPRWLQLEFSQIVQTQTDKTGVEISAKMLIDLFYESYLIEKELLQVISYKMMQYSVDSQSVNDTGDFSIIYSGMKLHLIAKGVGVLDSFISALSDYFKININIVEYNEQTLQPKSTAQAIAFFRIQVGEEYYSGVARHKDIVMASLKAISQAMSGYLNRQ